MSARLLVSLLVKHHAALLISSVKSAWKRSKKFNWSKIWSFNSDMGSFYVEKPIIEYEKETTSFIDNSIVCDRLAAIRGCLTKNINLDEGEDGLDDIERACENIEYWSKPESMLF